MNNITSLGGNEASLVLCRHGKSYFAIMWSPLQRCIPAESSFSSNAHGSTIPDMADIIDKFILNKVSRDTAKMTTSGSQRGKRVKKVGCRSTHCVVHCVIETHWMRLREMRCVGMVREVDLSFNSLCSQQLFLKGKKRKIGQTSGKT